MKKKIIEKIEFLKLPRLSKKNQVKYVGRTAIIEVKGEEHFFLEVYENKKSGKDIPICRIVVNSKDFGTYWPKDGTWTRNKLTSNGYYSDSLAWNEGNAGDYQRKRKENTLYAPDDLKRLKKFFKDVKVYDDADWWRYVEKGQHDILYEERRKRESRRYEKRQQALHERMENTPELPEQKLLEYVDLKVFRNRHNLYYKKSGRMATVACSACGCVTTGAYKGGDSYESTFERRIQEPVAKQLGFCPSCKQAGIYMPQGRMKSSYEIISNVFIGQRYKEKGFVVRFVEVFKQFQLELNAGAKGDEMVHASEELQGVEIARAYFEEDKPVQIDYHKHDGYTNRDYWDDCNLYGMRNIHIGCGLILPETFDNIKGTCVQYSALKKYTESKTAAVNPIAYLKTYMVHPQIEMLVKLGLSEIVDSIEYNGLHGMNEKAKSLHEFFRIRKENVGILIGEKGNKEFLKVLQTEKRLDQRWTRDMIREIVETGMSERQMEIAVERIGMRRMLNWIAKYSKCEYGTRCTGATARIKHITHLYFDYLSMRNQLGYDMTNSVYLRPRNIEAAHKKMVDEQNKKLQDKRMQEVAEKFPDIKKNYRKLRKRFFFEDDKYTIRPARNAGEIVAEGRELHHCVGGDNYLRKHNTGESFILFLRFKEQPDTPYVTVELSKELRIIQWYGAHDKKPDEKNIQKWLNAYVNRLKLVAAGLEEAPEGAMQQMLAFA